MITLAGLPPTIESKIILPEFAPKQIGGVKVSSLVILQKMVNKSKLIHFTGDRKYDPQFPKIIIDFLKKHGHNNITPDWFYY